MLVISVVRRGIVSDFVSPSENTVRSYLHVVGVVHRIVNIIVVGRVESGTVNDVFAGVAARRRRRAGPFRGIRCGMALPSASVDGVGRPSPSPSVIGDGVPSLAAVASRRDVVSRYVVVRPPSVVTVR